MKELFHACGRAADAAAGGGDRPGRGGQVAAGVGVREVRRRAGRAGVVAPRPVPVLRRRGGVLGVGARWSASAWASPRRTRRGRRGQAGGGLGRSSPTRRARLCGGAAGPAAGCRGGRSAGGTWPGRSCSPGGGCSSSELAAAQPVVLLIEDPSTPTRVCWSSWTIWSTGPVTCRSSCWRWPGRSWAMPGPGWAAGRNRTGLTLDPLDRGVDGRVGRCVGAGHAGRGPADDHRPRRRAFRCSRWRRSAR